MGERKDGGPAFPVNELDQYTGGVFAQHMGMSLRDYFAGHALATAYAQHESSPDKSAEWAYQVADALLSHRSKGEGGNV